ncbi:MAG: EamA family transporter, partial [Nitriliruptorales bacterium]|nr:EamA family transporter [Nitriliruptorales bacterium]
MRSRASLRPRGRRDRGDRPQPCLPRRSRGRARAHCAGRRGPSERCPPADEFQCPDCSARRRRSIAVPVPTSSGPPEADPATATHPLVVVVGLVVGVLAVSTAAIFIRLADAPPLAVAFWRCALGAAALWPFAVRARRRSTSLDGRQRRQLAGAGLFLAAHFAAFISSLSFTTVASAAVLVTAAPLFVGIGAAVFLGEAPSRQTWIGIVVAMVGAVGVAAADFEGASGSALTGDALAFAGAALVAGYLIIGRAARRRLPVSRYAAGVYTVAAAALLVASLATGSAVLGYTAATWWAIVGLVVGPQLLGHTVFNSLLVAVPPTVIAVVVIAEPVGSTILAYLLLDEAP